MKAVDRYWHEDCLKCTCCDCRLGEVGSTLYTKGDLILCKRDYLRYVDNLILASLTVIQLKISSQDGNAGELLSSLMGKRGGKWRPFPALGTKGEGFYLFNVCDMLTDID